MIGKLIASVGQDEEIISDLFSNDKANGSKTVNCYHNTYILYCYVCQVTLVHVYAQVVYQRVDFTNLKTVAAITKLRSLLDKVIMTTLDHMYYILI